MIESPSRRVIFILSVDAEPDCSPTVMSFPDETVIGVGSNYSGSIAVMGVEGIGELLSIPLGTSSTPRC